MKISFNIKPILAATLLMLGTACTKQYNDFGTNPNRAESVPPSLIFTAVANSLNDDDPWSDVTRFCQFDVCNYNYYGDQRYDWTGSSWNYITLNNIEQMVAESKKLGLKEVNQYAAVAKFFKAFFYYRMTNLNGDLPLKDALKGINNPQPAYNTQKEVFRQILTWLDEANTDMESIIATNGDLPVEGDIYFSKLSSWRKVNNAFRLRVLIALSKKESDADLQVKQQFATLTGNKTKYPVPEGMADNLQFIYNGLNKYPSNPDNLGFDATRYNMSATYLNNLVTLKDPRAFITAEPASALLKTGKKPDDITAYNGANSGEDLADMSSKMADVSNGAYSVRSRSRFYSSYVGEPAIIVGYPEYCFNMAEAINRGWITGDAEDWYKKGMKASIAFYGIPANGASSFNINKTFPYNSQPGSTTYTIPFDFDGSYYQQAPVKYAGNNETGLRQVLLQKYLAFFQNSGWEAYFNYRRTGVPTFLTGTGTGNGGIIPKRFQYPNSEQVNNTTNWKAATSSQGFTNDNINSEMWLVK